MLKYGPRREDHCLLESLAAGMLQRQPVVADIIHLRRMAAKTYEDACPEEAANLVAHQKGMSKEEYGGQLRKRLCGPSLEAYLLSLSTGISIEAVRPSGKLLYAFGNDR